MRKLVTAGAAALTLIGGSAAMTAPADAQHMGSHFNGGHFSGGHFNGGFRGGRGFRGGGALAAGIFGFGLGAALASPGYYYGPGPYYYSGPGYYDDGGYSDVCYAPERVWDPYVGHYVIERVRYAC